MTVSTRRHRRRIEHPNHARFLTFSCYRRIPVFQNDAIKDLFVEQLLCVSAEMCVLLHAWVVMPNHVHMLIRPAIDVATVPRILARLKRPFAQMVLTRWRRLDAPILGRLNDGQGRTHFWQRGGGYDRNVFSDSEIAEKIIYIESNPVRAGLVKHPGDYRWSSAYPRGAR